MSKFKISIFIISTFYFLLSTFYFADAASPQFLVNWQSKNFSPSWYQGKIFPTKDSTVEVSFELMDNNKIADLSKEKIRWYINDNLEKNEDSGLGIKSLRFSMPDYPGRTTEVRIEIFHYKGGEVIGKIINIPSVWPEVVIDAPYADNKIGVGLSVFKAFPFFFNVENFYDLSAELSAMGQRVEGAGVNAWTLNLNIDSKAPKDTEINLSVSVKSLLKELEFASKNLRLVIK
ncbi:MAG: hypothetical protein AAB698_01305 [Patescibacteria group bacterium]